MTKVLVADGNPINMELALQILSTEGFTAEGAFDGIEVIKKAEKELYDLILMEIKLPGMNGVDVRKTIKNKPSYRHVPVIALTACAMKGDKEKFLAEGFDDYIAKPIDVLDFIKKMEKYNKNFDSINYFFTPSNIKSK